MENVTKYLFSDLLSITSREYDLMVNNENTPVIPEIGNESRKEKNDKKIASDSTDGNNLLVQHAMVSPKLIGTRNVEMTEEDKPRGNILVTLASMSDLAMEEVDKPRETLLVSSASLKSVEVMEECISQENNPVTSPASSKVAGKAKYFKNRENLTCVVCGDYAEGRHYSVICCQGCKAFYRRNYKKIEILICRQNNNCDVRSKKKRKKCMACRYQACLKEGMTVEHLRTSSKCNIRVNRKTDPKLQKDSQQLPDEPPMSSSTWWPNNSTGQPRKSPFKLFNVPARLPLKLRPIAPAGSPCSACTTIAANSLFANSAG